MLLRSSLLLAALALGACGAEDERPVDVDYLTSAVFRPSCGTASCHSSAARTANVAFDTPEEVCKSYRYLGNSTITAVLRGENGAERMPADAPLPEADILLIEDWVSNGVGSPADLECAP